MNRSWLIAMGMVVGLCGCAAPTLSPIQAPGSLVADPGLVGEWATEPPTVTRVVVSQGVGEKYAAVLTIHDKGEFKASLALEVCLTQIGPDRYADLFLAKVEREELAGSYGFLALPVHQIMRVKRDGDSMEVSWFDSDWMGNAAPANGLACERVPIGGDDVAVIVAQTGSVREFLEKHGNDPGALAAPMVFRRVGK